MRLLVRAVGTDRIHDVSNWLAEHRVHYVVEPTSEDQPSKNDLQYFIRDDDYNQVSQAIYRDLEN